MKIRGGVYDSLVESKDDVLVADNASVLTAMNMFLGLEGIDIEPAAGVALACLRDAVEHGKVDKESTVLLNVTGGGRIRLGKDHPQAPAKPQLRLTRESIGKKEAGHRVATLCAARRRWQGPGR
jgi:cysteate synthase